MSNFQNDWAPIGIHAGRASSRGFSRFGLLGILAAGIIAGIGLAGCASDGSASASTKKPLAQGNLYRQAEKSVLEKDRELAADCALRTIAKRELYRAPIAKVTAKPVAAPPPMSGMYGPGPSQSTPVETQYSEFIERWTVSRCGQEIAYLVTFTPAMNGGSTAVTVSLSLPQ